VKTIRTILGGLTAVCRNQFKAVMGMALGLAALTASAQTNPPANDNFANAQVISGLSGSVTNDNTGATLETGEPSSIVTDVNTIGYGVNVGASIWFAWTAPVNANGTVTFISSSTNATVLAAYTGNSVQNLTLLYASDDIATASAANGTNTASTTISFYAVANTTYFIAVYGYNAPPIAEGGITLSWNQIIPGFSAGTFRFTSTSYNASQRESIPAQGGSGMSGTPGARVSITRVGGAAGRVNVGYVVTNSVQVNTLQEIIEQDTLGATLTDSNNVLLGYSFDVLQIQYYYLPAIIGTNTAFLSNVVEEATFTFNPLTGLTVTGDTNLTWNGDFGTNVLLRITNADSTIETEYENAVTNLPVLLQVSNLTAIPFNAKNPNVYWDYLPASGVLTFNDFEMTKDIYITLGTNDANTWIDPSVVVQLTSVALDTNELQTIPSPSLDVTRSTALVTVRNVWQAGYDFYPNLLPPGDVPPPSAGPPVVVGSSGWATNIINFERSTVRVNREAGTARIAVYRGYNGGNGGNSTNIFDHYVDYSKSSTMYYTIDAINNFDDWNTFTLQSGSDYAIPDNATKTAEEGVVDFTSGGWGSVTFPADAGLASAVQYITIPITNNDTVEFNKDIHITFDYNASHLWTWDTCAMGDVDTCTVTILYDKQPAGAVDRNYNPDNDAGTIPPKNANPGVNGPVNAVAVQADGKGIIAGLFTEYNATNAYNIARALPNGAQDIGFIQNTGQGANAAIHALALDSLGGLYLGGEFSSFNSVTRKGIARLNTDGTLDETTFLPGNGVNGGTVYTIVVQPNGQILIGGAFSTYNNTNRNCIARLNPDGSVDATFDAGAGPNNDVLPSLTSVNSLALQPDGRIVIGGDFTSVDGVVRNNIARLNADGSLDTSFDPGAGANDVVNAVAVDTNGLILLGGAFTQVGTLGQSQAIARLNADGSLDTTFGVGSGANDIVQCITLQPDGGILLGGIFTSVNQTRRVSIARLLANGTVDTSFMDTAYNQFAGLINSYYDPGVNPPNPVACMALETNGNILIGGNFIQVGGGFNRSDIRPRSNVAQLIGGSTPGPGNMALTYSSYTAAGQATNSSSVISVSRINGTLGPAIATLEPSPLPAGPGAAVYGVDYIFNASPIEYGTTWSDTWMLSDGVAGINNGTSLTVVPNNTNANTTLNLQLTQPIGSDIFFLGGNNKKTSVGLLNPKYLGQDGENIPLGVALGQSLAPMQIIRNNLHPGVLSFSQAVYYTNQNSVTAYISVVRTGGTDENITVKYKTVDGVGPDGAHAGTDYTAASGTLSFVSGSTAAATNQIIAIKLINQISALPDKYLTIQLYQPGVGSGYSVVPTLGQASAQLILINANNRSGLVGFDAGVSATNSTSIFMTYGVNENVTPILVTVTRQGGSQGDLKVWVASSDGTAVNGINYVGFTNQLEWADGVSGPQTFSIPIKQDFVVTPNLVFNLSLFSASVNGVTNSQYLGNVYTNAFVTVTNVDEPGVLEFSQAAYSANKNGGSVTIPVVRVGGTAGNVSATFITYDGTAFANTNYYATNNVITFTNGEMSKSFQVQLIGDMLALGDKTVTLALTNASPTNSLGSPSVATLTIVDDYGATIPPGTIDQTYNPAAGFNGPVFALALEPSDGKLIVGGNFTDADGQGRRRIARLNADGTLDAYFSSYDTTQGANDIVRAVLVQTDGRILIGGLFTNYNGVNLNHLARLNYNASLDSSFTPGAGADNAVYAMAEAFIGGSRVLYVGGSFATYNGIPRNGIVRLSNAGTVDTGFSLRQGGPNGTVYALAVQTDGKIVIGGDFTEVSGVTNCNHIARLNQDGSVDTTFAPTSGTDNSVHSLAIQLDGKILIGGLFSNVNGLSFNNIARLNANGSVDGGFNPAPGANGDVQTISLQADTRILLGGTFTSCNGLLRGYVTRLNPNGTVDPTINFGTGADNFVAASVIQPDRKIVIGGGFLNYNGQSHPYLARIYGGSISGAGSVQFTSSSYQVHETGSNAVITVVRLHGTAGPNADGTGDILVPYSTIFTGSAVDPLNYSSVSNVLDFPMGESVATFVVPVRDDGVVTSNLTLNLSLYPPTSPAQLGNIQTATLKIINDDSAVSFGSALYSAPKNVVNGVALINVVRQGGTNGTTTVYFATTTNGTAVAGLDFTPVSQIVTFNPGDTNEIVDVPIINNGIAEGNRTIGLQLSQATGSMLANPTNATLTILDNVNAPGVVSFAATNYSVVEGGGVGYTNVYITVQRTLGTSGTISVDYATQDGPQFGGAMAGTKYLATNGVLKFTDGETSKTFAVQVINTPTAEGPEIFYINLISPSGTSVISPSNTVVTILNTNTGIGFDSPTYSYTEPSGLASGSVTLNVVRYNNTSGTTTVNYSTTNVTAVSGVNYLGVTNGTLTFNPGVAVLPLTFTTLYDPLLTGTLTFNVGLANPSGGAQLTSPNFAVVSDYDANAGVSFYTNSTSVYHNSGHVAIPVVTTNINVTSLTVNYSTIDGSAIAGTDYTSSSGTLQLNQSTNGFLYNDIEVPILMNNAVLTNRTFTVILTGVSAPGVLIAPTTETVTIIGTNTPAGLSFSTPIIITGIWGSTNVDNTMGAPETGDPAIAGVVSKNAPVWFQWTAPAGINGEVTLDTIGTVDSNQIPLDTVLGVYSGNSLISLNQLAANDDLYPKQPETQFNVDVQNIYNTNTGVSVYNYNQFEESSSVSYTNQPTYQSVFGDYKQPFAGPSGLRFNATGGTTYYIAVDSQTLIFKQSNVYVSNGVFQLSGNLSRGNIHLNWAYHPAGVFRFATEQVDQTGITDTNGNAMLLYECSETEGVFNNISPSGSSSRRSSNEHGVIGPVGVNESQTTLNAEYTYDVHGLLVTVTRVAGSSGRVTVDYTTMDGDTNLLQNGDVPAVEGVDYAPVSGTLIFDDFEMSKTILVPIYDDGGLSQPNRDFMVVLSNPQRDTAESGVVSVPRVDPIFGKVLCRILDCDIDPNGPSMDQIVSTNAITGVLFTNLLVDLTPTNAVFNFSKKNYRVSRDVQDFWRDGTPVTVYVNRMGTNITSQTVYYRFDNYFLTKNTLDDDNIEFPLLAGSDYATPYAANPPLDGSIYGPTNFDFQGIGGESGSLTFPGGKNNPFQSQPIHFNVFNNHVTSFNKDLHIEIYTEDSDGNPTQCGMVDEATVTILFDDTVPPAGSVDELYNPDFSDELVFVTNSLDQNTHIPFPGASSVVHAVALTTNNEAIIAGGFYSYTDSTNTYDVYGITRLYPNGQRDTNFNSGTGVNVQNVIHPNYIQSLLLTADNKIVIGGDFTSYNGFPHNNIARLNADGSLDNTFAGSGFNGMVYSVLAQADGRIVVGGNFTSYSGQTCQYVARLNTNGVLDTTFNASNLLSGPVYAMALSPDLPLSFSHSDNGTTNENDQMVNLGLQVAGTLNVTFNSVFGTNEMQIYYGIPSTNVPPTVGVLLYDSGTAFTGATNFILPFGPVGNFVTNVITVVMNPGGAAVYSPWSYNLSMPGETNLVIGGQFTVAGQNYANIARLNTDGSLDSSFNPGTGPVGPVRAVAWQGDGKIVLGGSFANLSGVALNNLARLNADGSIDGSFQNGTGADDTVWSLMLQPVSGLIYVGGQFSLMNGTHRLGFARLYTDGTLDTSFMDTAYNQFAGLSRITYTNTGVVYSSALQGDGNVIIGGSFQEVGGGEPYYSVRNSLEHKMGLLQESMNDPNLWWSKGGVGTIDPGLEPKSRDGVRNHSNVARLIGGATPGPGNIGMLTSSYAVNKSGLLEPVTLVRQNGSLGYASVNFFLIPGLARSGADFVYNAAEPLYPIEWEYDGPTRLHSDGLYGANGLFQDNYNRFIKYGLSSPAAVNITINDDTATSGNLSAQFRLANPVCADEFYLGGQNIPLGVGLGESQAPFTVIDDSHQDGVFGFSAASYVASNSPVNVGINRASGAYGTVQVSYQTVTNGSTAIAGVDYRPTNGVVTFISSQTSGSFPVTILNNSYISGQEKTINLQLVKVQDLSGGNASLSLTSAVVRLINPNDAGYLTFSTNFYFANLSGGSINFVVNRTVGSKGTLTVQYGTTDGALNTTRLNTAVNGVNYVGSTNTLTWLSGDVSPRIISIPLIYQGALGPNMKFSATLFNATLNGANVASLLGTTTNATLAIINDTSVGALQFSSANYSCNENGGNAAITVVRTGSAFGTNSVNFYTADGTAFAGTNYATTNGVLTFLPGDVAKSFNVRLLNAGQTNLPAASLYFNVNLATTAISTLSAGSKLGTPTNAVVQLVSAGTYNQPAGGVDQSFDASLNASVLALAVQSTGQIVVGGTFTVADDSYINRIARFNTDGTLDSSFLYGLDGADDSVNAVVSQTDDRILVGGAFTSINDDTSLSIARLMTDGSLDSSFDIGAGTDGTVFAIAESFLNGSRVIYVGGNFSKFDENPSPGVVRVDDSGAYDSTFAVGAGASGTVYALAVYPTNSIYNAGKVVLGGAFTNFEGFAAANVVRLNTDGTVDTNFSLNVSVGGPVRAVAIQLDGSVLIGGDFTNINSTAINRVARLNPDGTLDASFATNVITGINGTVNAIAVQPDNRILVAGQFSQANGVTRQGVTRLLPSGAVDTTINFGSGANGAINAMVIQPTDGKVVIGGGFTEFNGVVCDHIARLFGGSTAGSGVFQFTTANYVVDENAGNAAITVERTGNTGGTNADGSGDVYVAFTTANGSAVAGVNYTYTTNYIDFPAGETLETVYVPVQDDGVLTTNLMLNLGLSNPSAGALGDLRSAYLMIVNVDSDVQFSSVAYQVAKNTSDGYANIEIIRNGGTVENSVVNFTTTTNGTAVIGTDYYPTNVQVLFAAGVATNYVQVPVINNGLAEGDRTITMILTNALNTFLIAPSNALLTIQDNVKAPGNLFFLATNFTANSSDGVAYLSVGRTNGTSGSVSATYTTVALTGAGAALPGVNYVPTTNTVSFGDGQVSETVAIPLLSSGVAQSAVSVEVDLSNPSGGAGLVAPTNTTLIIYNTNVVYSFVLATNVVSESSGYASVVVERFNNSNLVSAVNFATTNGSAIAGVDYTSTTGTLSFAVGQIFQSISIPLLNHSNYVNATFGVNLSPLGLGQLIAPSNTVVVIQGSAAGISFVTNATTVMKTNNYISIPVYCSNTNVQPAVASNAVPLQVSYTTVDGSARAGFNYNASTGILYFTNGVATNYINIVLLNDGLVSSNLTFSVLLTNITTPGVIAPYGTNVVTIDESGSGFSFSQSAYTVYKNSGYATINVNRSGNTNSVASVDYSVTNGTAISGLNFYPTNGTLVFTNGVTSLAFNVPVIASTLVEPNLYALLRLANPTNGQIGTPGSALLTILENGGSYVIPAGAQVITNYTSHLSDGVINSNDTVTVSFALRDSAGLDVTNLIAVLQATNNVIPGTIKQMTYGPLHAYRHSVSMPFTFTAHGTNMLTITPTFLLYDNTKYIGPASFVFTVGSWTATFANTNINIINDNAAASLYPSLIPVSGLGNTLLKATVTLTNLSHSSVGDLDVLVVSPSTNTLIMAHAGIGSKATHVTLTFDDASTNASILPLPQYGAILTSTNRSTQFYPVKNFP